MSISLVVHGGAWDIPDTHVDANKRGVTRACEAGWSVLERGGSALDAIVAAIVVMEDDATFDAGVGSILTREGRVEMDAGLMDGKTLDVGACAAVTRIKNPILLARNILNSENVLMVGEGAEKFARECGIEFCEPSALVTQEQLDIWEEHRRNQMPQTVSLSIPSDTVGAVARDAAGNLAAGNSTGGRDFKMPGRVGDSPIVGCGFLADNLLGGATCTGWGEAILRTVMAKSALDFLKVADPMTAAEWAVQRLERVNGTGGIVLMDAHGRIGLAHNTPRMARAWRSDGQASVQVAV